MTIDKDKSASITTVAGVQFKIDDGGMSKVAMSPPSGRRLQLVAQSTKEDEYTVTTTTTSMDDPLKKDNVNAFNAAGANDISTGFAPGRRVRRPAGEMATRAGRGWLLCWPRCRQPPGRAAAMLACLILHPILPAPISPCHLHSHCFDACSRCGAVLVWLCGPGAARAYTQRPAAGLTPAAQGG